jgi:hypothetical protein
LLFYPGLTFALFCILLLTRTSEQARIIEQVSKQESKVAFMSDSPFVVTSETFPAPAASAPSRIALSVPVDDSGKPAWDRVSEKVKAKFKQLIDDPSTQAEFISPAGTPIMDEQSARMMGKMLVGSLFQMQMLAAAIRLKLTKEELEECFKPNFQIAPGFDFDAVMARVLQKRGPEWLANFADEITVCSVIVISSLACWGKASDVAKRKAEAATNQQQERVDKTEPVYAEPVGSMQ